MLLTIHVYVHVLEVRRYNGESAGSSSAGMRLVIGSALSSATVRLTAARFASIVGKHNEP